MREERRAEIDVDLWESQHDVDEWADLASTRQVLARLILGIPDDLTWRVAHNQVMVETSRRIALAATVAGGMLFLATSTVITSDVNRPRSASPFVLSTRGIVDAEISRIVAANAPESWKMLQAGILAVAIPVAESVHDDVPLYAQTSASAVPATFEVASIKPSQSGDLRTTLTYQSGGRFIATNVSLLQLLRDAYPRSGFEISGGPNWIQSERFDVSAEAVGDPSSADMRLMLRTLLIDRFELIVHHAAERLSVYEVVLARSDGRFGPQLRRAAIDCADAPAAAFLLLVWPAVAQSQTFEAVSIKAARPGEPRNMRMRVLSNGDLEASAVPVLMLVQYAYDVPVNPSPRLAGLPGWRDSYDIDAKAPANAIPAGLPESEKRGRTQRMIRGLLADRFNLVMRVDQKTTPVYALTVASGGSKLQKSTIAEKDCIFDTATPESCHDFIAGRGHPLNARAITMDDLARYIENWTDLPVVNRTTINGLFDVQTEGWIPMRLPPPPPGNAPAARFDDLPTIFTVLRTLGLELKQQQATEPLYTVEHIERPAAE